MPVTNYDSNAPAFTEGTDAWADEIQCTDSSIVDPAYSLGQVDRTLKSFMLQAYGGVMDATVGIALTGTAAQVTFDAFFGPTAYNCTVASDKDDITADLAGIYEYCFQADVSIPTTAGTVTCSVRDDGTDITGALATVGWITADLGTKRQICIHGFAAIAAGSVLDVAALTDQNQTATFTNSRFWIKRWGPLA